MKNYVFLIAMKNKQGGITPHEVAAPTLTEAIDFLKKETGLAFAYEITPT